MCILDHPRSQLAIFQFASPGNWLWWKLPTWTGHSTWWFLDIFSLLLASSLSHLTSVGVCRSAMSFLDITWEIGGLKMIKRPEVRWKNMVWHYLDIHWLQISDQGRFWFDFCPVSLKFAHFIQFQNQMIISRKNLPLHVLIFKSCWVCPGISAFFPGISAFFPQISAQKNRHIFTQRRSDQPKR